MPGSPIAFKHPGAGLRVFPKTESGVLTFADARASLVAGLTSAQLEALGWNAQVRDYILAHLDLVVRTSDSVVTIGPLPAFPAYDITATENIPVTVPKQLLAADDDIVAVPTITINPVVAAPFISSTTQLFAPSVSQAVTTPLITSGSRFAPSVAYEINLPFKASGLTMFAPSIAYAITLPLITSGSRFAPSVAYEINLPFRASGLALFAPIVDQNITITLPTIASGSTLFAPSLAYAVTLPFKTSGLTMFAPSVAYAITLPSISTTSLFAPSLAYAVTLPFKTSGLTMFAPSVAYEINLPFKASGLTMFPPSLAYAITLPVISATAVFAPAVASAGSMALPTIGSGNVLFTPIVVQDFLLQLPLISATSLFAPSVIQLISLPTIASGNVLMPPIVRIDQLLSLATIASGTQLYAPVVSAGLILLLPTIPSGSTLFTPSISYILDLPFIGSVSVVLAPGILQPLTINIVQGSNMPETARLDLEVKQGDTFKKNLTFEKPPGFPLDLSSYGLTAQLKRFPGDIVGLAAFEILPGSTSYKKILRLAALDTTTLNPRNYWWDFQWITPSGDVQTILEGIFTVTPQATLP